MEREYTRVTVTPKAEKSLKGGHPWIYAEEITATDGGYENGDIVDAVSKNGKYLGSGFINDNSKIKVRIISDNTNDKFDIAFFERRVAHALDYRRTVMGDDFGCCRLIFGEADRFPGLTVDRFGDVLSVQILSLGIEKRRDMILPMIIDNLRNGGEEINAVILRNDVEIRKLEGLETGVEFYKYDGLKETDGITKITENGITYEVDYINGQKTGFFLDQKYNRLAVAKITKGKRVLDCFTHTGAFALNCAKWGAQSVTAVDVSFDAVKMVEKNAGLNGLDITPVCADVFEYLNTVKKGQFDFIILDPPAFTKSRKTVGNATNGYLEINEKAMRLLPRGGYLATCSCSHFMTEPLFKQMLHNAASSAGVALRQIEARQQSCDHPILWNVPETEYLKFFIFQVV